jgi:SAM-dependent methyltransferase
MTWVKSALKKILPETVRSLWRRQQLEAVRRRNSGRQVADIFAEIYRQNRWGGDPGSFNSGSGSSSAHADGYARAVCAFIRDHNVRRVVDLGCGDFRIGARLIGPEITYTGIDIVPDLVRTNTERYGSERVRFACLDIISEPLPEGDLCLIRQVLQHLSNEQIRAVLANVAKYRYVIVTEHYPAPGALQEKNLDKPCGEDVRIYDGSAVYLDAAPFSRPVSGLLLDVEAAHYLVSPGERIRSYLLEQLQPQAALASPTAASA